MDNFVAIDFETANFKPSSVCSQKTPLRRRPLLPFHRENAPGYIAGYCGYDLKNHHHALADAEACAIIALQIL